MCRESLGELHPLEIRKTLVADAGDVSRAFGFPSTSDLQSFAQTRGLSQQGHQAIISAEPYLFGQVQPTCVRCRHEISSRVLSDALAP